MRFFLAVCLAVSAAFFAPKPLAQSAQFKAKQREILIDQYIQAAERTVTFVNTDFFNALDEETTDEIRSISVNILKDSQDYKYIQSQNIAGKKRVQISIEFILATDYIDLAFTIAMANKLPMVDVLNYTQFIADQLLDTAQAQTSLTVVELPSFCQWIGLTPLECQNMIAGSESALQARDLVKSTSFATLLGHEYAHHTLDHLSSYNRSSCKKYGGLEQHLCREVEADVIGMRYAIKAGYLPILGSGTLSLLAALEESNLNAPGDYPPPPCRIAKMIEASFDMALTDEEFLEYLNETSQLDQVTEMRDQSRSQLQQLRSVGGLDCSALEKFQFEF